MNMKKIISAVFMAFLFILSASVTALPASGFTAETAGYGYSRQCFYSKPYIFDICWNISDKTSKSFESQKISLSDNTSLTVWYDESLSENMDNKDVTAALTDVLKRVKKDNFSISKPMVMAVKDTGKATPEKLVKQYYKDGDIACCGAVFPYADSKTRNAYLKKAYNDGRTGYFSVFLDCLCDTAVTESYCAKAYKDGDTACFSICLDHLEDMGNTACAEKYAEKAYCDGKTAFFSILSDDMSSNELKTWYDRACRDGKTSFKAICRCYDDWYDDDWDDDDDYYVYDENTGYGCYHHGHHGGHHGC